ncbi:MAG: hypothetical protein COV33_01260 [Candidatus Zambryskibacteria bacterium CG10_big_fil_rev_8_21_14_0_10_34_34]|uniref:Uncharacterized protein n=1 Tax=Candidatus Zambryskibacteria bacterium CG10_big_fil_rev_8_21_14_0_10_34_34 TaxID=1975114 RepID=A0A2H0R2C3_9BACT|nr:MAG: hypothetical protein COV33_01260 [Candidatus Zambryskibacteria bacterium CG10_big_fil_rev_8_21_14_0_10_34_34]
MDTFNPNQMPPMQEQSEKKSIGPLVAVIIILALIIVGGLYFLKTRSSQPVYEAPTEGVDTISESLNQQSDSDELNSIEADLNATDLDNLDQGAAVIEAELQ